MSHDKALYKSTYTLLYLLTYCECSRDLNSDDAILRIYCVDQLIPYSYFVLFIFFCILCTMWRHGDGAGNTVEENSSVFFLIRMHIVAISKGMRAVKLCCNKILQFLTVGASCQLT